MMADADPRPAPQAGETNRKDSVAAVVTFWMLGVWTLMMTGVFFMVLFGVKIEGAALGVLAGVIGTQTTFTATAIGFWLSTSIGAKSSGDALAQLAGAGPRPPANPLQPPAKAEE